MKHLIVLLILLLPFVSTSQLTENRYHVSGKYSFGKVDSTTFYLYSVSGEYFLNRYIGLNYNFDLMFRQDNLRQFHSSVGALAGPPLIVIGIFSAIAGAADNSSEFDLGILGGLLGLAILVAPDGVSFHIPVSYRWDISPYANVLGIDFVRNKNTDKNHFRYACSFGVKSTFLSLNNFTFSGFAETRKVAGMNWSAGAGFGLGYAFGKRSDKLFPDAEFPAN